MGALWVVLGRFFFWRKGTIEKTHPPFIFHLSHAFILFNHIIIGLSNQPSGDLPRATNDVNLPPVERPFNRGGWENRDNPVGTTGWPWGGTSLTSSTRWTKTNIIREVVATGGPPGGATEVQIDGMGWGWGWDGMGWGWMLMVVFFIRQNILGNLGSCWVFSLFCCFFGKT